MKDEVKNREKKLTELGARCRAGQLMSSLFRAVASEKTELMNVKVPGSEDGKMQVLLVSKAEAIVRDIVEKSLPVKDELDLVDAKVRLEYRKLVLDRVDGRAGTIGEDESRKGVSIPDRISEASKGFLNAQAGKAGKKKTGPPVVKK